VPASDSKQSVPSRVRDTSGEEVLSRLRDPSLAILNVLPRKHFDQGRMDRIQALARKL